jgi:hypothetical protein
MTFTITTEFACNPPGERDSSLRAKAKSSLRLEAKAAPLLFLVSVRSEAGPFRWKGPIVSTKGLASTS